MFLKYVITFLLVFIVGGNAAPSPGDEFQGIIREGEISWNNGPYLKYIMPGTYAPIRDPNPPKFREQDLTSNDNEHYKILTKHFQAGHIKKFLTFSVYDDNMREAAIALYKILYSVEEKMISSIIEWAFNNINNDVVEYAMRLLLLYKDEDLAEIEPPFVFKPNYYINSETILKAIKLKLNRGVLDPHEAEVNQIFQEIDLKLIINTNYSGWNLWNEDCRDKLDYFREDISLNSYYYGVHLLYPFWMTNDELTNMDIRYAERYYFIHQQLLARYNLEKEHLKQRNISTESKCYDDFIPYLTYENGLPFPARSNVRGEWNDEYARLKSIDIAIKECITRGVIFMDNSTKVDLNEDNYIDLLTKLIRANYESVQTSKSIRDLFGYGGNAYPYNRYNPAPSVLHHPQTTLRDPLYWYMIQNVLKYFIEYSSNLEPFDFSKYQSEDIVIVDKNFSKITTYYYYYQLELNKMFNEYPTMQYYTARQKRLTHLPYNLSFTVNSKTNVTSIIKLFLGPQCQTEKCWNNFSQFYELESFSRGLEEGLNIIKWTSETSSKYSFDDNYNKEIIFPKRKKFTLFKFPESLVIPKGLNEGLNLTLFILILPLNEDIDIKYVTKHVGFPFHRQSFINGTETNNYKFYNISIYHKENSREMGGYFSPHLN